LTQVTPQLLALDGHHGVRHLGDHLALLFRREHALDDGEASLYGQFCPIAMAAELLATRWTVVVLGEMPTSMCAC
jgi:hypothetical protein